MSGIQNEQEDFFEKVPIGAIFRHYKGKDYKIISIGRHSEDLSLNVVYQALYDSKEFGKYSIWVRPLKMFLETVTLEGKEIPRFTLTHLPYTSHE